MTSELALNIIVAVCTNHGIGYKGSIPWLLRKDLAHFSKMTKLSENPSVPNAVIMGRKTWNSLPVKFKPLPGRFNVVLSRSQTNDNSLLGELPDQQKVMLCASFNEAIDALKAKKRLGEIENVWVIGGSSVYEECLNSSLCDKVYLTKVLKEFTCDTFFPSLGENFKLVEDTNVQSGVHQENDVEYEFQVFKKIS